MLTIRMTKDSNGQLQLATANSYSYNSMFDELLNKFTQENKKNRESSESLYEIK